MAGERVVQARARQRVVFERSNEALEGRVHAIEVTAALQHAIAAGRHRPHRGLAWLEAQ